MYSFPKRTRSIIAILLVVLLVMPFCTGVLALDSEASKSGAVPQAVNPYLPLWECIPDGEPYVFEDPDNPGEYRVYIYGSHDDREGEWCGFNLTLWSAPVDDLSQWRCDGEIFSEKNTGFQDLLYAPDVAEVVKQDGTKEYYLYPNCQGNNRKSMVAKASRPDGPFEVVNWKDEGKTQTVGTMGFDPAVFVDDDGRVYGYWGFKQSFACELDPKTMYSCKPDTTPVVDMIPNQEQSEAAEEAGDTEKAKFRFFEASSIRKIEDTYVFIYSRASDPDEPEGYNCNQLAYAYSTESPLGPWTYGGVIVDAGGEVLNPETHERTIRGGNTHGSICEINGQWYVFYHRNLNPKGRQGMAEPIDVVVNDDGSVKISRAEVTSQGFSVDGLNPYATYSAGIACYLTPTYTAQISPNRDPSTTTLPITNIKHNTIAGYKYFNFSNAVENTYLMLDVIPQGVDTCIDVYLRPQDAVNQPTTDKDNNGVLEPGGECVKIGRVELTADMPEVRTTIEIPTPGVADVTGKWGLFFVFSSPNGDRNAELAEFYNLGFVQRESDFEDTFTTTTDAWETSGAVTMENEMAVISGQDSWMWAKAGRESWTDYHMSVDVNALEGAAEVRFRQTDEDNFYSLKLLATGVELYSTMYGQATRLAESDIDLTAPFSLDVDAVGSQIAVRVNGAITLVADSTAHNTGSIGFKTYSENAVLKIDSVAIGDSNYTPPIIKKERVDTILVDGQPLPMFNPEVESYLVEVTSEKIPEITATSSDATVKTAVVQAESLGRSTVVWFAAQDGTVNEYQIGFYNPADKQEGTVNFSNLSAYPQNWVKLNENLANQSQISFGKDGIILLSDRTADYGSDTNYPGIKWEKELAGDWEIEAHFETAAPLTEGTWQHYGIALRNGTNLIKHCVQNRKGIQHIQTAGSFVGETNIQYDESTVWLKFTKQGSLLKTAYSSDGNTYIDAAEVNLPESMAGAELQIFAVCPYTGAAKDAFSVTLKELRYTMQAGTDPMDDAVLNDLVSVADAIGQYVILDNGTAEDQTVLAEAAEEILNARGDVTKAGATCEVMVQDSSYVLQVKKDTAVVTVEDFEIVSANGIDYKALTDLCTEADSLSEEQYTFASWNKLETALAQAKLCTNETDALELIRCYTALQKAMDYLKEAYTVGFNTNGGTLITAVKVENGKTVHEPAAPTKRGYTFAGWYSNEELTIAYDFSQPVISDMTLYAKWIKDAQGGGVASVPQYTINVTQASGGKISPTTTVVSKGSSKTFTITPDNGYKIVDVIVDGKSAGVVSSYTFKNVTAMHTITAKFEKLQEYSFTDVQSTAWYAEAVQYVVKEGLMNGTSSDKFSPNGDTTRGMIVTILYRLAGNPEVESDGKTWWSDARVWAMKNGVSDGTNMDKSITREQLATMLYRYAKLTGENVSSTASLDSFQDADTVSAYAMDAVKWAISEGVVTGKTDGIIDPLAGATRAETAAMLQRVCALSW